jgi:hypothetical protein
LLIVFSLVIAIETQLRAVKSAPVLRWNRQPGRVPQLDPLAVGQHHLTLRIRLGADGHISELVPATVVAEADEEPLDRRTTELAGVPHPVNGTKPTT